MAAPYQNYRTGTFLRDLVVRPEFLNYVLEDIFHRCAWIQSGVVVRNSALDVSAGGTRLEAPSFIPINPVEEIIESNGCWGCSGEGYLTPQKIQATSSIMTILHRGFAYAVDDLSKLGTGTDPMEAIKAYLAKSILRLRTATLLSHVDGLFGPTPGDGDAGALGCNYLDFCAQASPDNYLGTRQVLTARAQLGERGESLTAIAMHSAVYYYLVETGALTFSTDALQRDGGLVWGGGGVNIAPGNNSVAYFHGMRVIVDDMLVDENCSTCYPVYMFAAGAVYEGQQQALRTEEDRNILSKQDVMSVDYHYGFHVPGTSYINGFDNPANDAIVGGTCPKPGLSDPLNWQLTYQTAKMVPIVKMLVTTPYVQNCPECWEPDDCPVDPGCFCDEPVCGSDENTGLPTTTGAGGIDTVKKASRKPKVDREPLIKPE